MTAFVNSPIHPIRNTASRGERSEMAKNEQDLTPEYLQYLQRMYVWAVEIIRKRFAQPSAIQESGPTRATQCTT
jgi:hypothetical protein